MSVQASNNNMDYVECKSMPVDCLKTLKFLSSSIYQTKVAKLILTFMLTVEGSCILLQIYFGLKFKNKKQFIAQAPVAFAMLYAILEMSIILSKNKLIENISQELYLWSIDSAGKKIEERIEKEAKWVTIFSIATIAVSLFASIFFIIPDPTDPDFVFPLYLVETYFPNYSTILSFLGRLGLPLNVFISLAHSLQFIYYTQHLRFQGIMFREYIEKFTQYDYEGNYDDLYYSDEYQNEMSKRLNFLIDRHNEFKALWEMKKQEMDYLIGIFSLAVCCTGTSVVMWVLMFYKELLQDYLLLCRYMLVGFIVGITFCSILLFGQLLENESTWKQVVTEWYCFNKCNTKKFLIFTMNGNKDIKIEFLNRSVNFELGLQIARAIYAVLSVLVKMKNIF